MGSEISEDRELNEFRDNALQTNDDSALIKLPKLLKFSKFTISAHDFLLEGIRYNARRISRRWAVLCVLPIAKIIR